MQNNYLPITVSYATLLYFAKAVWYKLGSSERDNNLRIQRE